MNILWKEIDVWNDLDQEWEIGGKLYKHRLLNSDKYYKFLDQMTVYILTMHDYFGDEKILISYSKEKLIMNWKKWLDLLSNKSFVKNVIYNIFIACFFTRVFFPERIVFTDAPIKWLFFKPVLKLLDWLHAKKTKRISFKYFWNNTSPVQQTSIFWGILYEQTDGVKKKIQLLVQAHEKKYLLHLRPGSLSKIYQGAVEFQASNLTGRDGKMIDPATIKSAS